MSFANNAKTTFITSFSEEAGLQAGGKRAQRSAKNAVLALDEILKIPRVSKILGSIQGGKDLESRIWCTAEMKKREVDGLIVGGMYENDHGVRVREIVKAVCEELRDYSKIIALSGAGRPLDIMFAAQHGVTHFESMWPFKLASEGKALDIDFSSCEITERGIEDDEYYEPEINLNDKQFQFQKGPLVEGCVCQACKLHHRGYIHHLLMVHEMTANTLLAIHNTQVYKEMVSFINKTKSESKLQYIYSSFVRNFCLMKVE